MHRRPFEGRHLVSLLQEHSLQQVTNSIKSMQRLLNSLGNDHSFSTLEKSYEQSEVREPHMRLEYDNKPLPHMEYVHRRIQHLRERIESC